MTELFPTPGDVLAALIWAAAAVGLVNFLRSEARARRELDLEARTFGRDPAAGPESFRLLRRAPYDWSSEE